MSGKSLPLQQNERLCNKAANKKHENSAHTCFGQRFGACRAAASEPATEDYSATRKRWLVNWVRMWRIQFAEPVARIDTRFTSEPFVEYKFGPRF